MSICSEHISLNQGNLPMPYLKSVLDVYDIVLRNPTACNDMAANKVKQEIIQGLGKVILMTLYSLFHLSHHLNYLSVLAISAWKKRMIEKTVFILSICQFLHLQFIRHVSK